jgi:hypothetical protein
MKKIALPAILVIILILAACAGDEQSQSVEPPDPYPFDMRLPIELWDASGEVIGYRGVWFDRKIANNGEWFDHNVYDPRFDVIHADTGIALGAVIIQQYSLIFVNQGPMLVWHAPDTIEGYTRVESPANLQPGEWVSVWVGPIEASDRWFNITYMNRRDGRDDWYTIDSYPYIFIMPHTGPAHADFTVGPPFGFEFEDIE